MNEIELTPEEMAAAVAALRAEMAAEKQPECRRTRRAGFTKNKGQGQTKARRHQAKTSRKINRGNR